MLNVQNLATITKHWHKNSKLGNLFTFKSLKIVFWYKYFCMISSLSKPNIASFISCVAKYILHGSTALFLVYFKCCTISCYPISRYHSFLFSMYRWCSLLSLYDLQVRAVDSFLMCRHLMVVIILSIFFCIVNIGY